jgi:hypothetical protein
MENITNMTYYDNIVVINWTMQIMVDKINQIQNKLR